MVLWVWYNIGFLLFAWLQTRGLDLWLVVALAWWVLGLGGFCFGCGLVVLGGLTVGLGVSVA